MKYVGFSCLVITSATNFFIRNRRVRNSSQKIKDDKNFYIISNIQGVLNLWRMRNLTLEGRIVAFKTLAISKIVLALLTKIPYQVVKELEKI